VQVDGRNERDIDYTESVVILNIDGFRSLLYLKTRGRVGKTNNSATQTGEGSLNQWLWFLIVIYN